MIKGNVCTGLSICERCYKARAEAMALHPAGKGRVTISQVNKIVEGS